MAKARTEQIPGLDLRLFNPCLLLESSFGTDVLFWASAMNPDISKRFPRGRDLSQPDNFNEERYFGEFRRKVKAAEVLSASMERLLLSLRFTGKVSVVMQNGRVLKSGYEEGYFRQRDSAGVDDDNAQKL